MARVTWHRLRDAHNGAVGAPEPGVDVDGHDLDHVRPLVMKKKKIRRGEREKEIDSIERTWRSFIEKR